MYSDSILSKGVVNIEVISKDGSVREIREGNNTVNSSVKNKITDALQDDTTNFGCTTNLMDDDDFTTPSANDSGIFVKDNTSPTPVRYQTECSLVSSGDYTFTMKGILRAAGSYTLPSCHLGNKYNTTNKEFDVAFSDHTFQSGSPLANNPISLVDGDQLNITWTMTIADN